MKRLPNLKTKAARLREDIRKILLDNYRFDESLSNRLNQVMKTLTAVSIVLMTDSLIAGIYGMNFVYMPELHTRYGYFIVLAVMAVLTGGLVWYFKRIKWL